MIVVTGGLGFIGSNLVRALNRQGREDLLIVDSDADNKKTNNISGCHVRDIVGINEFRELLGSDSCPKDIELIFHQGACADTTEGDEAYMLDNNYQYSLDLLHYCENNKTRFIYASSAAVYGNSTNFDESPENEKPINIYAKSKLLLDNYARTRFGAAQIQIVGLRYFNVYGRGEVHKGHMASVGYHFNKQLRETGVMKLFEGTDGYNDGGQERDFIHVDDIISINLWFMKHPDVSGIYNVGTGNPRTFNDVASSVESWHKHGEIEYIDFPQKLRGKYQSYTKADLQLLRKAGCKHEFTSLESGMTNYLNWLNSDLTG